MEFIVDFLKPIENGGGKGNQQRPANASKPTRSDSYLPLGAKEIYPALADILRMIAEESFTSAGGWRVVRRPIVLLNMLVPRGEGRTASPYLPAYCHEIRHKDHIAYWEELEVGQKSVKFRRIEHRSSARVASKRRFLVGRHRGPLRQAFTRVFKNNRRPVQESSWNINQGEVGAIDPARAGDFPLKDFGGEDSTGERKGAGMAYATSSERQEGPLKEGSFGSYVEDSDSALA